MTTSAPRPRPRERASRIPSPHPRRARTAAAGVFVAVLAALLALVFVPQPQAASAADYGPGFDDADNGGAGRIGAYVFEGRYVYCLEPQRDRPLGQTTAAGELAPADLGVSAEQLAQLNWVISTRGQSNDPIVTSAVALFVWSIVEPTDPEHPHPSIVRVPEAHRDAVRAELAAITADAAAVADRARGPLTGALEFSTDSDDWRTGAIVLRSSDPDASALVTLDGGVFGDGARSATLTPDAPRAIEVDGSFHAGSSVEVRATATLRGSGEVWRPSLASFETPGAQLLGGAGGAETPAIELSAASDPQVAVFEPIVTTAVASREVLVGEPFVDVWTPGVQRGSWLRDEAGNFAEVLATGTLYGPFASEPRRTAEVPDGAPVAAIVSVTLGGGTADPTLEDVRVSTGDLARPVLAREPGYYVWVVTIASAQQPNASHLPSGYAWRDDFGVASEISHVAPEPRPATTPTPTATHTPTATEPPTPSAPATTTASAPPPPPAGSPSEAPGASGPSEPAPSEPAPSGNPLAVTGAPNDDDWMWIALVAVVAGLCLVIAAAIKRADARVDRRREAARS